MAKIEITDAETPSQAIVKAAAKSVDVVDETGRTITLRKPKPLAKLDFAKAVGGDSINLDYKLETFHLQFIAAIDGSPVATPSTDGELRALYARLDDEGNTAAQSGVLEHFMSAGPSGEDALKNS